MTDPRGIRNKNPGNLRYNPAWKWQGVVGVDEKSFAIFDSPERGLHQFGLQLRRYSKRGIDSLTKIIPVYAPKSDNNDEAAYIASVSKQTGIPPDRPLNLWDRKELEALMRAFTRHEQGKPPAPLTDWYDDATYGRALDTLVPLTQSRTVRGTAASIGAAVAGAVIEVANDVLPQAADAAAIASPLWPEVARWVLIAVVIAGAGLALYSRLEARKAGIR